MRARSMTSTVLGTSEIARSVRVAVTTTRSNSVPRHRRGRPRPRRIRHGQGPCPAAPGTARTTTGWDAWKDSTKMETVGELASGVAGGGRPGKGSGCPAHGRKRGAGRPPDLLGQNQLVVAGMPQPVALVVEIGRAHV